MSLTGKSSLSLKKKDVKEQKSLAVGFRKLTFAHKATSGDTGINLSALSLPSEMAANGFTNPNISDLNSAQLLFYKQNLTLVSSLRGMLMQDLSYSVQTSSRIVFNGFTALENEIFVGVIDYNARTGLNVVDAAPLVSTGTLAVGTTDYNVGTPFEIGKYSGSSQVGQVVVYRNGVQQFRNTGNSSSVLDGNYYEVDAGNGLGVLIRFNSAAAVQADNILVFSHGLLAYKPDGSVLAQIENLAGQLDSIIPTVADLAGQPESNYRAAPNSVDLKAFGDRVLTNESAITALQNKKNKVQTKFLAANVTTNTTMTNLTFNNLVVGTWYEITGVFAVGLDQAGNNDDAITINIGGAVTQSNTYAIGATDTLSDLLKVPVSIKFQAASSQLTFTTVDASAGSLVFGSGTLDGTYVQLEERLDLQSTVDFT